MDKLTKNEVNTMLNNIDQLKIDINNYKNIIYEKQQEINKIRKELLLKCNHNKIIDRSESYEKTSFYCSICLSYL